MLPFQGHYFSEIHTKMFPLSMYIIRLDLLVVMVIRIYFQMESIAKDSYYYPIEIIQIMYEFLCDSQPLKYKIKKEIGHVARNRGFEFSDNLRPTPVCKDTENM